jgi:predicted HicB family RNase H-like nuclease
MEKNKMDFSEEEIKILKKKALDLKKSKQKKVKTITISSEIHSKIKKYCASNGVKIGEWVEQVLYKGINEDIK